MSRTLLAAGGLSARQRRLALMQSLGFYASWPMYADLLTVGSGVISQALDEIAARALTFASGQRPAYDTSDPTKPCAVFAGASVGSDAAGLLNGRTGVTVIAVVKDSGYVGNYAFLYVYGPSSGTAWLAAGGFSFEKLVTDGVMRAPQVGNLDLWNSTSGMSTAWGVYVERVLAANGAAGSNQSRLDGTNVPGTWGGGNVTAWVGGNYSLSVGAEFPSAPSYLWRGNLCHLAIGPYLSDADADRVQVALRAEWGTP